FLGADRPADTVDLTTLFRICAGDRSAFAVVLALATFINTARRRDPGQRRIAERAREVTPPTDELLPRHGTVSRMPSPRRGKRDGLSPASINRRIAWAVEAGIIMQQYGGPTDTCGYQVTRRYLAVMLELRQ